LSHHDLYLTDAQLAAEISRCEFCEEKPCKEACPVDCSPADFIMAAKLQNPEDIQRAASLIMTRNPLGGVCGGVCPDTHCQAACSRATFDNPVEIPTVQAAIVARAKAAGSMPVMEHAPATGKKVAIVGAGPAGLGAAVTLAQMGHTVELLEADSRAGGACALIPEHRLPEAVLQSDIDWALDNPNLSLTLNHPVTDPAALLNDGFDAVVVAEGLHAPVKLGIPGEEFAVAGNVYLRHPEQYPGQTVAIIGGGAIAVDCAVVAQESGASVEMFALENLSELPLTAKERALIFEYGIAVSGRTEVLELHNTGGSITGLKTLKVALPKGKDFHPANIIELDGTEQNRPGFDRVVIAIGNRSRFGKLDTAGVFATGDGAYGPATVVEAVAAGKNTAINVHEFLQGAALTRYPEATKSRVVIPGYNDLPVSLETDFFGRTIPSPFILSAAPPSDGYEQMKQAYDAGWAGGIMKTAFDGLAIHIPGDYMHNFDGCTYGNCDNVSGHPLSRVCREITQLVKEYPDRLTGASTGGPVSGDDAADKLVWQKNMRLLEEAGAMVVEFSLSCPQGGDGTEGDIVSQSAPLTAKIVDWLMETSDPEIPKLFKLTGAVTSIAVIVEAIKEVLDRYPNKKAGVTLANTFPTLAFRERLNGEGRWEEGVLVGASGAGVAPISNLSLASAANVGVAISGNGGPMNHKDAAHFLALGVNTVQFCTIAMRDGVGVIEHLHSGLSHLMQAKGFSSMKELIGCALPNPIVDFMELTPAKRISQVDADLCQSCGNCTRCSYHAIRLNDDKIPETDPARCIGCSICAQKCFAGALHMRTRTPHETAVLVED
jgi:dihydropyrimidine dehydrogenase (NAD+) subunit PreA